MTSVDREVAQHSSHGSLEAAILAGLNVSGQDLSDITPENLVGIDEFPIGGAARSFDRR